MIRYGDGKASGGGALRVLKSGRTQEWKETGEAEKEVIMKGKLIALAVVVFVLVCTVMSLYKTWEAEKKRLAAEREAEEAVPPITEQE